MVVAEVASLAHAHGVQQPVFVRAVPSILVPAVLSVAGRAHVFGVMLPAGVGTFCDLHHLLRLVEDVLFYVVYGAHYFFFLVQLLELWKTLLLVLVYSTVVVCIFSYCWLN